MWGAVPCLPYGFWGCLLQFPSTIDISVKELGDLTCRGQTPHLVTGGSELLLPQGDVLIL